MKRVRRLEIILAALLFVGGIGVWQLVAPGVAFVLRDAAPDKDDYLLTDEIRRQDLKIITLRAELDAARAEWVKQQLASAKRSTGFSPRVRELEQAVIAADRIVRESRQQALRSFDDAAFGFNLQLRSITLAATVAVVAGLLALAWCLLWWLTGGIALLQPQWGATAAMAAFLFLLYFVVELLGVFGASSSAVGE